MLQITVPAVELWDDENQRFIILKEQKLQLEHSLVSLSKWESKWKIPFMTDNKKTYEQTIDYIRCMTITQNVDPSVYNYLTKENVEQVNEYMNEKMTATTFHNLPAGKVSNEILTNEVIYYQMITFNIPFECQKWHLNRLLTLIKVCSIKSQKPQNMPRGEAAKQQAAINAARRKKHR